MIGLPRAPFRSPKMPRPDWTCSRILRTCGSSTTSLRMGIVPHCAFWPRHHRYALSRLSLTPCRKASSNPPEVDQSLADLGFSTGVSRCRIEGSTDICIHDPADPLGHALL